MATDVEIARALATVAAILNDRGVDGFDRRRVQQLVEQSLDGEPWLTVDDGGGLHDDAGLRIGAIRRTPSGEWITERQNEAAMRSSAAIPTEPPRGRLRKLLKLLGT